MTFLWGLACGLFQKLNDLTSAGTSEISVSGAYSGGLEPGYLTAFGSEVLFNGEDASGHDDLWVTNGTSAGTSEISVSGANSGGLDPSGFTVSTDFNSLLLGFCQDVPHVPPRRNLRASSV